MPVALVGPQAVQAARAAQSGQHVQRGGRVVDIGGQTIAACHPELAERPMQAAHQAAVRRDSEAHASKRSQHPGPLEHDERRGYRHRAAEATGTVPIAGVAEGPLGGAHSDDENIPVRSLMALIEYLWNVVIEVSAS